MQLRSDLAQEAVLLEERARFHKAELARHRRALRHVRQQQSEFEARCAELGIKFTHSEGANHG